MISVSIPAGTLGLLVNPVTKYLFLESYKVSHDVYLKRSGRGKQFWELGKFFEFKAHLESNYISNSTVPMSFLVLRNKSERLFSRAELLVEADAGYAKYQEVITLVDVGQIPLIVNLPRIPLKEITVTENNNLVLAYKTVRIKITIFDDSLSKYESEAESKPISPSYTEFLNSRWEKKWDSVWNLDYIEDCKNDLKQKMRFYLVTRNEWPMVGEPENSFFQLYKAFRLLLGKPLFFVINLEYVISALFWVPIFLRAKRLKPSQDD